jgi:hypothetical protein
LANFLNPKTTLSQFGPQFSEHPMISDPTVLDTSAKSGRREKKAFSPAEDQALTILVQTLGENNWHQIAEELPGRSARQCRERWCLYLSPEVSARPWSPDEDAMLIRLYALAGPKWTVIAKQFQARSGNNVKNRQKQLQRRLQRLTRFGTPLELPCASEAAMAVGLGEQIVVPTSQDLPFPGAPEQAADGN